ncbi:MAG: hypothetical protein ABI977_05445 [Acidobacteriota bacterium]
MKNKIVMTISTLTLAVGLLLSVSAQGPGKFEQVKPKPGYQIKVNLKCEMGGGDVLAKLSAINNTSETIKAGKVIYYTTNGGLNGTYTLSADLAPGQYKTITQAPYPFTCQAHYFKP